MASPAGSPPSAQVVGNAFVHQYYNILYQSPGLVYRFYQESSKLGRSEPQGVMRSVTTMQAINEKILSMDYVGFRAEIKTVDAQESLNGGVLLLVTGYLTGKDNVRKNFTQSFFLATQDKGYFVLNDIFRYIEEADPQQGNNGLANGSTAPPVPEQEAPPPVEDGVPHQSESPPAEEEVIGEVYNPSDNEGSVEDEETPEGEVVDEVPDSSQEVVADSGSPALEEAPKKSYASIVKVKKEAVGPVPVPPSSRPVPPNPERQVKVKKEAVGPVPVPPSSRPMPPNPERQVTPAPIPAPAPDIPVTSSNTTETSSIQESEGDGHSVYIKSLPLNATPTQVEEEFKRFGPIKPGGIQVRSHKQQGFCFGFVEFETASAVQSAIEASPVLISGRQTFVEEKRPAGSRVSSRGRFPGRSGGFRSEVGRGRGGYGGRGYGRGDFGNRMDFGGRSGRGRGGDGGGGTYQRVDPTGDRGAHPGSLGPTKNAIPRASAPAQGIQ